MVQTVFLVRDPVRVYDSWKNVGWTDMQSLVDCSNNLHRMLSQAASPAKSWLVYERLIVEQEKDLKLMCFRWGVPFSESMLDFEQPFGSALLCSSDRGRYIRCEKEPIGLFSTVEAYSSIKADIPYHGLLSNAEKDAIEEQLGRQYLRYLQDDVARLRSILHKKSWFGFDLGDTLHEFRRASGKATEGVLKEISRKSGVTFTMLKDEHQRILQEDFF
jgi:hypothetical protein